MNVKALIEELQKYDPEKLVVISGYEGGHAEVTSASEIRLKLDVNTAWYYGPHEEHKDGECHAVNIE